MSLFKNSEEELSNGISSESNGDEQSSPAGIKEVPRIFKVYGIIIMVFGGISIAAGIVFLTLPDNSLGMLIVVLAPIYFFIVTIVFRLGKGLRKGERNAVLGICILGVAGIVAGLNRSNPLEIIFVTLFVATVFVPPIIGAFKHWEVFS